MQQCEIALQFLEENIGKENVVGTFNYIYSMTTENIKGYIRKINNITSVLTVAASGDHALNCIVAGAEYLHIFDKNPAAIYITKLKLAAASCLNRTEFIDFFILNDVWDVHSDKFFAYDTYKVISSYLSDDGKQFWDRFYAILKERNITPQKSEFIGHTKYDRETLISANLYLDESEYSKLKEGIARAKIEYFIVNVVDLDSILPQGVKYNTILFSNISDYLEGLFPDTHAWNRMQLFDVYTTEFSKQRLAFDGEFYYAYIYMATTGEGWTEIDDIKNLVTKLHPLEYRTIPSICRHREGISSLVDCMLLKRKTIKDL